MLTVGTLIDHLESQGRWKMTLDVSRLFSDSWKKVFALRSTYLRGSRAILLQDL